jgi:hypothetical protein
MAVLHLFFGKIVKKKLERYWLVTGIFVKRFATMSIEHISFSGFLKIEMLHFSIKNSLFDEFEVEDIDDVDECEDEFEVIDDSSEANFKAGCII